MVGKWTYWFDTGQIAARGEYAGDRKVGSWEYWDAHGRTMEGGDWRRAYSEFDFAADDYSGAPRGENWPEPDAR